MGGNIKICDIFLADREASLDRAITEARTRSRRNAGRWKIRSDKREARRRPRRNGGEESERATGTRTRAADASVG